MKFHAGAAGISENSLDSFALECLHENIAAAHARAKFAALLGGSGGLLGSLGNCIHIFNRFLILIGRAAWVNKKPTTVSSRGFLSKFFCLRATSTDGIAAYDYDAYQYQGSSDS